MYYLVSNGYILRLKGRKEIQHFAEIAKRKPAFVRRNILIWNSNLGFMQESYGSVRRLDQDFLIFVMKTKDRTSLLFEQVAIHRTGTHHHDLLLHTRPLRRGNLELLFRRVDL